MTEALPEEGTHRWYPPLQNYNNFQTRSSNALDCQRRRKEKNSSRAPVIKKNTNNCYLRQAKRTDTTLFIWKFISDEWQQSSTEQTPETSMMLLHQVWLLQKNLQSIRPFIVPLVNFPSFEFSFFPLCLTFLSMQSVPEYQPITVSYRNKTAFQSRKHIFKS